MKKAYLFSILAVMTTTGGVALAGSGKGGAKMDANKDGKVTLAEAQEGAKQHFQALDKNKNGVLTKDELEGRGKRFLRADANKDGQVTLTEAQTKAREKFQKRDKNKDGVLTGEELKHGHGDKHGHDKRA
jgi:Ca2+-binding EF-hand superfamily protein